MDIKKLDKVETYKVFGIMSDDTEVAMEITIAIDHKRRMLSNAMWKAFTNNPVFPMQPPTMFEWGDDEVMTHDPKKLAIRAGHELEEMLESAKAGAEAQERRSDEAYMKAIADQADKTDDSPLVIIDSTKP